MVARLQWLFCFVVCFFSLNPVFQALGIRGTALLLALLLLTLSANRVRVDPAHKAAYLVVALFLASSGASSWINNTVKPLLFAGFFAVSALCVLQTSDEQVRSMVRVATRIFAVFIAMAGIGIVYHLLGGGPLVTLVNADGRDNGLYLTTFSNAETFTIRPSAIYDEPGAFSFYLCMLVVLRSRLGLPLAGSAALLLGGLLTQSIAHVMFTLVWFLWALLRDTGPSMRRRYSEHRWWFALAFVLAAGLIYQSGVLDWALERAVQFYENPWTNPRQRSMDEIIQALAGRPQGLWYGFDDNCVQRLPECFDLGENPLTPLIYGGLLASWPYYLFLAVAVLGVAFLRDGLLLLGVALLLLQRPYLLEFPYSALFALGFVVWFMPRTRMLPALGRDRASRPLPAAPLKVQE